VEIRALEGPTAAGSSADPRALGRRDRRRARQDLEACELPGFGAFEADRCVGLVTYELDGEACEIVTIDALDEGKGIGTALLEAIVSVAREARCCASSC
jgi:GNAT superfamily N-acetyltransferase